ncbi:hypothetical protein [Sphingomonas aracearum]|uniref:hypothetical protein n=1 Tax=Sphingomonas aracearum TaxID=2283317 RepID=UPI0011C04D9E|nr:hypothetical protein [Sphingomonas aracearum]
MADAIGAAGLALPVTVTRWDKFDPTLKAQFYPDGSWAGEEGELIWVSSKAVPSKEASFIRAAIESEGIPQFIEWAKAIETLDARSPVRREKQTFTYRYPVLES